MKEEIEGSHFLLILGHKYLKQRKLRTGKKNIFVVYQNVKKFAFDSIYTKPS
jgi:hypothetical protein